MGIMVGQSLGDFLDNAGYQAFNTDRGAVFRKEEGDITRHVVVFNTPFKRGLETIVADWPKEKVEGMMPHEIASKAIKKYNRGKGFKWAYLAFIFAAGACALGLTLPGAISSGRNLGFALTLTAGMIATLPLLVWNPWLAPGYAASDEPILYSSRAINRVGYS